MEHTSSAPLAGECVASAKHFSRFRGSARLPVTGPPSYAPERSHAIAFHVRYATCLVGNRRRDGAQAYPRRSAALKRGTPTLLICRRSRFTISCKYRAPELAIACAAPNRKVGRGGIEHLGGCRRKHSTTER